MKKQLLYKISLCLLVFCLVSTGIVAATTGNLPKGCHNKVITESDNGKTICIKQGDAFYLNLVEGRGTAYHWQLSLSSGLKQLSDRFYPDPRAIKFHLVGGHGTRVWKIKAVAEGNQQVKAIDGTETFTLNVKVVSSKSNPGIPIPEKPIEY